MGTLTLLYCDIEIMNYEEVTYSNFHNLKRSQVHVWNQQLTLSVRYVKQNIKERNSDNISGNI